MSNLFEEPVDFSKTGRLNEAPSLGAAAVFALALTAATPTIAAPDQLGAGVPQITELWLADTDTDTLLAPISDGDYFDPKTLPEHITVVAVANTHTESVRFGLDGVMDHRVENIVPYALNGDTNGDYSPAELSEGWHTVRATPFAVDGAGGSNGTEVLISFALLPDPDQIVVNTTADGHDAVPGDGRCSTQRRDSFSKVLVIPGQSRGTCTLRAAIEESNQRSGSQHIEVPYSGLIDTYRLKLGELHIEDSVVIEGRYEISKPTIDAEHNSRVIWVHDTAQFVTLSGLRLINGNAYEADNRNDIRGGGLYINGSWVYLQDMVVRDNHANFGGGIYSVESILSISRSVIESNTAGHPDDGSGSGGITQRGGGIAFLNGFVLLKESTVDRNRAVRAGGVFVGVGGRLRAINTQVFENEANSTGGGFEIQGQGWVELAFSTVVRNAAGVKPRPGEDNSGGGFYIISGHVDIGNSIIAENTEGWSVPEEEHAPDCYSVQKDGFTSFGDNIVGVVNDNCVFQNMFSDMSGTGDAPFDAGLGESFVYAKRPYISLKTTSPAIDQGSNEAVGVSFFRKCPNYDTRSHPRFAGWGCDIGAYEVQQ